MQVKEIMKNQVEVVHAERSVREAAEQMARGDFGALPVEDNDKMIGMVTDRDIVTRVVAQGKDPAKTTARDCMSAGIDYCYDDEEVDALIERMRSKQHRRIPVVNRDKRLVGIVSLKDLALHLPDEKRTAAVLRGVVEDRAAASA
jgi:CBS domain-containing protein